MNKEEWIKKEDWQRIALQAAKSCDCPYLDGECQRENGKPRDCRKYIKNFFKKRGKQ